MSFLRLVAQDIISRYGTDLSHLAIVFPNKRASLFLNQELAALAGKPIWAPRYITISELFRSQSALTVADPILSVATLFKAYNQHLASDQTIDHFWSWGETMLADFDDIDKNLADAHQVFSNVRDIHELDNVDYLTPDQRRLLKQFFETFSDDHSSALRQKFLALWTHLEDIYHTFNRLMRSQGLAYEGALYREVALKPELTLQAEKYIFVGFNVLQKAEQRLFERLQKEGRAEFYWDFDHYYLDKDLHEAGRYIRQFLPRFHNQLDSKNTEIYSCLQKEKEVTFIAASTEDIQARYISDWLRQNNRIADGERTAIVLADESLLKTAIHCLPPEAKEVNITLGYPLSQSPVVALAKAFINLHNNPVTTDNSLYTRAATEALLRHPYFYYLSPLTEELLERLAHDHVYHPTPDILCLDDALSALFAPIPEEGFFRVSATLNRLVDLLQLAGMKCREADAFVQESIFRMFTVCNRLKSLVDDGTLSVELHTLQRLLDQIASSTTMPFHGEPAVGLQIMGVLETRNLDFDHVLVLSASEGNLPKSASDTSLIPHSIRKAFSLTTIENKIAIQAYYFYRLLQRPHDITLTYNSSTENGHTGQMSRFMLQLLVESPWESISQRQLVAKQEPERNVVSAIEKTPEVMAQIDEKKRISPSALGHYLRCPLRFYYQDILKLRKIEEEALLDNRVFGNIYHKAAELMYNDIRDADGRITPDAIDLLLSEEKKPARLRFRKLYDYVDQAFNIEFFHTSRRSSKVPHYNGLQLINREAIVKYLIALLRCDREVAPFVIVGTELPIDWDGLAYDTPEGERTVKMHGIIDRLDCLTITGKPHLRVVDYKTGANEVGKMQSITDIFLPEKIDDHSDYYLQTLLYSLALHKKAEKGLPVPDGSIVGKNPSVPDGSVVGINLPVSPNLFFIQHMQPGKDTTLAIADTPILDIATHATDFLAQMRLLLNEIHNPAIPLSPTPHRKRCARCDFHHLCKSPQP